MRQLLTAAGLVLLCASYAHAQAVCPMEMLRIPKLTLGEMFAKSEAKAKAWKPDVVVASITNTSLGPLDEAGKSEAWNLMFFRPRRRAGEHQHVPQHVQLLPRCRAPRAGCPA